MKQLTILAFVTCGFLGTIGAAHADPAGLPSVGQGLNENPSPWPKMDYLYDQPSHEDAAGKVIVHWFCAPKIPACADDLARMIQLRDTGKAYIVAHINGTKADAKKFDPIRESEGVGKGTVAFGKGVTALMKKMAIVGPASIVVDVDGKVALVTTASSSTELDDRDAKVTKLIGAIKDYTFASDGPKMVKPDEKFTLSMTINLSPWLKFTNKGAPAQFQLTGPADVKCDHMKLTGDEIKVTGQQLVAAVTCSAAKGNYELRGTLRFGYDQPGGGQGMGAEDTRWTLSAAAGLGAK